MKKLIVVAAVLFALAGCSDSAESASASSGASPSPSPLSISVAGSLAVKGGISQTGAEGEVCVTQGGYDDIQEGTQVVVEDSSGKTLAIGDLGPGTLHFGESGRRCVFHFAVTGVPEDQKFYRLEIGHRGQQQYTKEDLFQPLELTLG